MLRHRSKLITFAKLISQMLCALQLHIKGLLIRLFKQLIANSKHLLHLFVWSELLRRFSRVKKIVFIKKITRWEKGFSLLRIIEIGWNKRRTVTKSNIKFHYKYNELKARSPKTFGKSYTFSPKIILSQELSIFIIY